MGCKFEERVAEALEAAVEAVRGARSALTSAGFHSALFGLLGLFRLRGLSGRVSFLRSLTSEPCLQSSRPLAKSIAINTTTASKAKQYKVVLEIYQTLLNITKLTKASKAPGQELQSTTVTKRIGSE